MSFIVRYQGYIIYNILSCTQNKEWRVGTQFYLCNSILHKLRVLGYVSRTTYYNISVVPKRSLTNLKPSKTIFGTLAPGETFQNIFSPQLFVVLKSAIAMIKSKCHGNINVERKRGWLFSKISDMQWTEARRPTNYD